MISGVAVRADLAWTDSQPRVCLYYQDQGGRFPQQVCGVSESVRKPMSGVEHSWTGRGRGERTGADGLNVQLSTVLTRVINYLSLNTDGLNIRLKWKRATKVKFLIDKQSHRQYILKAGISPNRISLQTVIAGRRWTLQFLMVRYNIFTSSV